MVSPEWDGKYSGCKLFWQQRIARCELKPEFPGGVEPSAWAISEESMMDLSEPVDIS